MYRVRLLSDAFESSRNGCTRDNLTQASSILDQNPQEPKPKQVSLQDALRAPCCGLRPPPASSSGSWQSPPLKLLRARKLYQTQAQSPWAHGALSHVSEFKKPIWKLPGSNLGCRVLEHPGIRADMATLPVWVGHLAGFRTLPRSSWTAVSRAFGSSLLLETINCHIFILQSCTRRGCSMLLPGLDIELETKHTTTAQTKHTRALPPLASTSRNADHTL